MKHSIIHASHCPHFDTLPHFFPALPPQLNVPDQRLPVSFTLRAQVTTTDLIFDPPRLDFGPCVVNEDTAVTLRVTNPSALPQTFGFVSSAQSGIGIKPNDGFGYILPGGSGHSRVRV